MSPSLSAAATSLAVAGTVSSSSLIARLYSLGFPSPARACSSSHALPSSTCS
jgi:hypothetical protein